MIEKRRVPSIPRTAALKTVDNLFLVNFSLYQDSAVTGFLFLVLSFQPLFVQVPNCAAKPTLKFYLTCSLLI